MLISLCPRPKIGLHFMGKQPKGMGTGLMTKNVESADEKKVTWLELFFDLVFVTAVSSTTHLLVKAHLTEGDIAFYGGEYLLMVFPMLWAWAGQTMFFNRYSDALNAPQPFMLAQMFLLVLMTASFDFTFGHTYHTFLLGYLGIRAITVLQYFIVARRTRDKRRSVALLLGRIFLLGLLVSSASLLMDAHLRYVVMYAGVALDFVLPLFQTKRLNQVPVLLSHLSERFGLFVLIALGENLVAMTAMLSGHTDDLSVIAYAFVSFLLVGTMWAAYFFSYEELVDHRRETSGHLLLYGHFVIITAIMLVAASIHLLLKSDDMPLITVSILYGAVGAFITARHLVFRFHRQHDVHVDDGRVAALLLLMMSFYGLNFLVEIPPPGNLGAVLICAVVDMLVQRRVIHRARRPRKT